MRARTPATLCSPFHQERMPLVPPCRQPITKNCVFAVKKFGVRRQAVFRATPLFEQCVSAHSAERKRCRDPRTARLLSPYSRFLRSRRRDRRRSSRRLTLPMLRDGTKDHPSAQRKAARGDTRPPAFASSRLRVKSPNGAPQKPLRPTAHTKNTYLTSMLPVANRSPNWAEFGCATLG